KRRDGAPLVLVLRVGNDSDDLDLALLVRVLDTLADRVGIGKVAARERLVDDADARRLLAVAGVEGGSPGAPGLERLEVVFANHLSIDVVVGGRLSVLARQEDVDVPAVFGDRRDAAERRLTHPG